MFKWLSKSNKGESMAEEKKEEVKTEEGKTIEVKEKTDGRKKKKIEFIKEGSFSSRGYSFTSKEKIYSVKVKDAEYFLDKFSKYFKEA